MPGRRNTVIVFNSAFIRYQFHTAVSVCPIRAQYAGILHVAFLGLQSQDAAVNGQRHAIHHFVIGI